MPIHAIHDCAIQHAHTAIALIGMLRLGIPERGVDHGHQEWSGHYGTWWM